MTTNLAELAFAAWQYEEEIETQMRIVKARDYHDGDQESVLTPRLRLFLDVSSDEDFSMNLTRGVIEAVTERLIVSQFKCQDEASANWAWNIWQTQRLDSKQNDIHEDAERDGEKFMLIDWSDEDQAVRFIPHDRYTDPQVDGSGEGCKAHYANDDPNQKLLFVSKRWVEKLPNGQARNRMTLYFPDRIEKYTFGAAGLVPLDQQTLLAEGDTAWPKPWVDSLGKPLGIPVAHFRAPKGRPGARDAWPIQSAVNKTLVDLLASADSTAFRMYFAKGFYPTTDEKIPADDGSNLMEVAPGRILGTMKTDASFDVIDPAPMDQLITTLQQLAYYLAIVTRTPTSRYQITGNIASADTLKQQDQSLLAKVAQRQMSFGDAWEDALTIARRLQNAFGGGVNGQSLDESQQFQVIWQSAEIRDRKAELEGYQIEQSMGVPLQALWVKMGYKPDEIEAMLQQREAELEMNARVAAINLNPPVVDQSQGNTDAGQGAVSGATMLETAQRMMGSNGNGSGE